MVAIKTETVWIGRIHVRPRAGNEMLQGAIGAVIPLVALASTDSEFRAMAIAAAGVMEFDVVEIKDVRQWNRERSHLHLDRIVLAVVRIPAGSHANGARNKWRDVGSQSGQRRPGKTTASYYC